MIRALHRPGPDEPVMYLSVGGLTNLAVAVGAQLPLHPRRGRRHRGPRDRAGRAQGAHARACARLAGPRRPDAPVQEIAGDEAIVSEARLVLQDGVRRIAVEARNSLDFHTAQDAAPRVERVVLTGARAVDPGVRRGARRRARPAGRALGSSAARLTASSRAA